MVLEDTFTVSFVRTVAQELLRVHATHLEVGAQPESWLCFR